MKDNIIFILALPVLIFLIVFACGIVYYAWPYLLILISILAFLIWTGSL